MKCMGMGLWFIASMVCLFTFIIPTIARMFWDWHDCKVKA